MIGGVLSIVSTAIDKIWPDADEANKIKSQMTLEIMKNEAEHTKALAGIIQAEAKSEGWLTRSWRPLVMIFLCVCLGAYFWGFAPQYLVDNPAIVEDLFDLLKLGIGGYIAGRTGEKVVDKVAATGFFKK